MHLPRAPRRASDAFLGMLQKPGDDNYNNPVTNVDFQVTPPAVRRMSLSQVSESFDQTMDGYFRSNITGTYSPHTSTIPKKQMYESTTNEIHLLNRAEDARDIGDSAPTSPSKSNEDSASRILKNAPHSVKREPVVKGHKTRDEEQREKSFGTNLTTGKREYLSQYQHGHNSHAANAADISQLAQRPKETRQEDTVSHEHQKEDSDSTRETDTTETSTYSGTDYETGPEFSRESRNSTPMEIY